MGVLKNLTEEYFGETIREEDYIDVSDLNVKIVDFVDGNKKHHYRGFRVVDSDNHNDMVKTLIKLIKRIIEERGNECDLNDIDVSNIKKMNFEESDSKHGVFEKSNFNGDISGWNTSNVTDMSRMFSYAKNFNQPIGNWNIRKVRDMTCMFLYATNFNQPIGNWNVRMVRDMRYMFRGAENFNQPIGDWNVENVRDIGGMFFNAESFDQDISSWKLKKLKDYDKSLIFLNCQIKEEHKPNFI